MRLSDGAKAPYSKREHVLFLIVSDGKIDTRGISEQFYGSESKIPLNGRKIVIGALSTLRKKIDINREPFRLASSERSGPIPMRFWIEKRRKR